MRWHLPQPAGIITSMPRSARTWTLVRLRPNNRMQRTALRAAADAGRSADEGSRES
jgi:hypothetical protein